VWFLSSAFNQASFFLSSAQIFLLNYTLFYCTQLNSPLTTTVTGNHGALVDALEIFFLFNTNVGNIKNIGETALGFAFFDVPLDPINILGIFLGCTPFILSTSLSYFDPCYVLVGISQVLRKHGLFFNQILGTATSN